MPPSNKNNLHQPPQYVIPYDSDVFIKRRNKEDFGYFQAISPLSDGKGTEADIFDKLANVPPNAFKAFIALKLTRNEKNALCISPIIPSNSRSQRETFNKGARDLIKQGIIKRVPVNNGLIVVRRGTFMMNPVLIKCKEYRDACLLWEKL